MKMLISVLLIVVETIIDKVEDCSVNYYAAGVQRGDKKAKALFLLWFTVYRPSCVAQYSLKYTSVHLLSLNTSSYAILVGLH